MEAKLRQAHMSESRMDVLGTGFGFEDAREDLHAVIDIIINTTVDLDAFHSNHPRAPAEWELALKRNFAQYQLYSLPRIGDAYYITCRLALLIYSDFILFPIPAPGIRVRLCSQLQGLIQYGQLDPEFLVWVTVMGALAAIDTPFQDWYVTMLGTYFTLYGVCDWPGLKRIVHKFLWWEYVLDPRIHYLWHEARMLDSL